MIQLAWELGKMPDEIEASDEFWINRMIMDMEARAEARSRSRKR